MADKAISELVPASEVTSTDLFVLEQAGTAKRLSGQTLTTFLLKLVEAHGGIVSINKTSSSGLVDTYTITMADLSTASFTVTNGAKGDKGDNSYVWVKYSSTMPTKDSDIYDTPDNYMGIYSGNASKAPTSYSAYNWFQIKGAKGDTGPAASIVSQSVRYQVSTNGTVIPSGAWLDSIPAVSPGQYLWTQSVLQFNTGAAQIAYSVSRFGIDGSGSVVTVNGQSPDEEGNVVLSASDVGAMPDDYTAPVTSVNGQTGIVTLDAASVHARPDTWTPTAEQVGAIPNADGAVTRRKLASDVKVLRFTNTTVGTAAWASDTTYTDFPYRAPIACSGVTVNHYAEVIFSPTDAMSGTFCPVTASYAGGVYIYASEIPGATVTIPTIVCTPVA